VDLLSEEEVIIPGELVCDPVNKKATVIANNFIIINSF